MRRDRHPEEFAVRRAAPRVRDGCTHAGPPGVDLLAGLIAGLAAGAAMDGVLRALYNRERRGVRAREHHARGGQPALRTAAERAARWVGVELSPVQRRVAGRAAQAVFGLAPAALYGLLRPRVPAVRAAHGLAYGAAVALLLDEGMNLLLGLTPGPAAFPWQTHARGLAGHLVFGATLEAVLRWLEPVRQRAATGIDDGPPPERAVRARTGDRTRKGAVAWHGR